MGGGQEFNPWALNHTLICSFRKYLLRSLETFVQWDTIPLSPGFVSSWVHLLTWRSCVYVHLNQTPLRPGPETRSPELEKQQCGVLESDWAWSGAAFQPSSTEAACHGSLCMGTVPTTVFTCSQGLAHRRYSHSVRLVRVLGSVLFNWQPPMC